MKGSDFAEQFNFAVAARSAEIMIEASGAKLGDGMKRAMMNRFATRVNGNYAAAQRPVLFQGFAGQAIGLFQTYSLNMMNNMFRYVGADKRTALTMLGLQAGVFGAGSIPGFKLLNEKVLKDTNGNTDLYQETSNIAGDELGSWMLYGLGSNLTGMGLYSRGNIAPHLATVIPTSVQELPVVKAGAKTVGAVLDLASNLGSGMDAGQAFATALASQGMSRPLQGVGVLYNGEVASTKGNKLYDVDLLNFTSTAARLMGSKSLKDSVMQDAYYRMQKYRSAAEEDAIEAFKPIDASIRMGNGVTDEMINNAFEAYTARGRTYDAFSRKLQQTMMLGSQGELMQMREKITSPEGQYMARVLADSE